MSCRKGQPVLSHNLRDLILTLNYLVIRERLQFLLHDNDIGENHILIFASETNLCVLCQWA